MPVDLGEYQFEVIAAYGATILIIGGIVVVSVATSYSALRKLENLKRLRKQSD